MYDELAKRLRDAATMSDALAVLLPHSAGNATAKLYNEAADAIEERDRHILTLQHEMMAEAESHIAEVNRLNKQIEALSKKENTTQWIPVTERLPDDRRDVQITVFWHDAWRTMYGYYDGAFWHLYAPMHTEVADVEVIGWMEKPEPMPLPEPPKEEV